MSHSADILTRYVFSTSHYSPLKNIVKTGAFKPLITDGRAELSVFYIGGLEAHMIWGIGQDVALKSQRTLYARGDISDSIVKGHGLAMYRDDNPPRHACILGWPDDEAERLGVAAQLAAQATLVIR